MKLSRIRSEAQSEALLLTTCVFFLAGWRRGPVNFDLLQKGAKTERTRWGGAFTRLTVNLNSPL